MLPSRQMSLPRWACTPANRMQGSCVAAVYACVQRQLARITLASSLQRCHHCAAWWL